VLGQSGREPCWDMWCSRLTRAKSAAIRAMAAYRRTSSNPGFRCASLNVCDVYVRDQSVGILREGGAFGNWEPLQKCIASPRTYAKFAPTKPNLLIIADDLKISLQDSLAHVDIALYADHDRYGQKGYSTSSQYQNLGALGIFRALATSDGIAYDFKLFDNQFALPAIKLPASLLEFKTCLRCFVRGTRPVRSV